MSLTEDFLNAMNKKQKKKTVLPKPKNSDPVGSDAFTTSFLAAMKQLEEEDRIKKDKKDEGQSEEKPIAPIPTTNKDQEDDIAPVRSSRGFSSSAVEEIAPVSDGGIFKKPSAFDDGWQFGDVLKTVGGTVGDVGVGFTQGILGLVEGGGDLLLHGASKVSDWVGADDAAEFLKASAMHNTSQAILSGADKMFEKYSVLGNQADMVTEGLGQVLGIMGTGGLAGAAGASTGAISVLTTAMMGASSMGSGINEAYQDNATDAQAWTYGAMKGVVDAGSELIFGGIGKTINALGVSKGLSSLDDMFAKKLSSKISNVFYKNLIEFGVKSAAEGVEEVLAGYGSAVAKKLTYMSDKELKELVEDENLMEQFLVGMATSAIAQSGLVPGMRQGSLIDTTSKGRDFITGLNQTEITVVDKVYENKVKEAETNGKKLSPKEKNKLYEEVIEDMDNGRIPVDTVEEVLGGDTFKAYKEAADAEEALKAEHEELGKKSNATLAEQARYNELSEQLKDTSKKDSLKKQLGQEVYKQTRDSRLINSYTESVLEKHKFIPDQKEYKTEAAKKTVENIVNSGLFDNRVSTHKFVDFLTNIAEDKGIEFRLYNSDTLAETVKNGNPYSINVDPSRVQGFITPDNKQIILNIDSRNALNSVVGHEVTHSIEDAAVYQELQEAVFRYARKNGDYAALVKQFKNTYANANDADFNKELTSELIGKYLFTDSTFVHNLSAEQPNVFKKVWNEIKYLWKMATAGSTEARELARIQKLFEEAYREGGKAKAQGDDGTRYSISGTKAKTANYLRLDEAIKMEDIGEATSEDIRQQTGWFRGYDGKWRFEISDRDMEFNISGFFTNPDVVRYKELVNKFVESPENMTSAEENELRSLQSNLKGVKTTPKNLSDYIKHDKLFEAYPQLKDIRLRFNHLPDGSMGAYNADTNEIILNYNIRDDKKKIEDTLIHEIQHAVQAIEGFAGGSSIEYWENQRKDIARTLKGARQNLDLWLNDIGYSEYVKTSMQQVVDGKKTMDDHWRDIEAFKANSKYAEQIANCEAEIAKYQQQYDSTTNGMTAYEQYENTAGEVEARDVELRRWRSEDALLEKRPDIDRTNVVFADTRYSLSNPENDKTYLDAVHRNDMETAQKMVNDVANDVLSDSKIRDKNGKLIPVYHGTKDMFYEFDTSVKGGTNGTAEGFGIYTSDNPEVTSAYGDRQIKMYANIKKPAYSNKKTISQSVLTKLIKDTCMREAQQFVDDGSYDNVKDALFDTWISNYTYTYDVGMERAYREVASTILQMNDNDMEIIQEVMMGLGIRDYASATEFYRNSLTPVTGFDGFFTEWNNNGVKSNIILALDSSQLKSADPVTYDDSGNVIPLSERFNAEKKDIRYSLSDSAEDSFAKDYLDTRDIRYSLAAVPSHKKNLDMKYDPQNASMELPVIMEKYDKILDIWERLGGELDSKFLNDWNNKVERPFSVFKKQAGYKYNVELSSMCKKGVPLFEAIDAIVKQEVMKELDTDVLGKEEKEILYDILKKHDFEIPCAICYVEQARQREGAIIDAFLNGKTETDSKGKVIGTKLGWNQVLDAIQKEMRANGVDYNFNYVSRDIATDKYDPADLTMDEKTYTAFAEAVKKIANQEITRINKESGKNRKLLKDITPSAMKETFSGKLPLDLKIFQVLLTDPSSRFKIQNDLLYSSMTTKNLTRSHNGLYSLFNSQGGVAGYKTKQAPTMYWGEILGKKWNPEVTRKEGGVRNQSNSDFQMFTLLDQAQMYMDFSAKGYYLQAYTKVISELKLFGLSKSKINASLIPKVTVYRNADGSVDIDRTMENAGLDENGNPAYDDFEGINHKEAFMLLEDPEYSKNIGGICIGYSDNHIRKLLDDDRVQLIIGYHDKTNDLDKRYRGARYAKNYNSLNEAVNKDGKTVHLGFNPYVKKAENKFKYNKDTETFEGTVNYNGKTYTADDIPRLAADLYLEMCTKKGYTPAYNDFKSHSNYYKLLADFSLYDSQGHYAPHRKVAYDMPDSVPYLDADGNKQYMDTEQYIKIELQKELAVRDAIAEAMADTSEDGIIPQFKAEVNRRKQFSLDHGGEYAPSGNWNIYGEDIRYNGEIAPPAYKTKATDIAPVAPVADVPSDEDGFLTVGDGDMLDWMDFSSEPSEKPNDPFEERDWKDVGDRKTKAYMFENPEVKPFFQAEAEVMLGDLQNSMKGERWYNDELYYNSGGEYGFSGTERLTTDDIAYLLDEGHYTYAQIEKGLKAIIEDNGKENNACSKRIEFLLNDRLRDGYTDMFGEKIPPNQEYLDMLEAKQVTEYSEESWNALTDSQTFDIAPPVENTVNTVDNIPPTDEHPVKEMPKQENKVAKIVYGEKPQRKKLSAWKWAKEHIFSHGAIFEDLSLKTGNRELQAKFDKIRRAESMAQHFIGKGKNNVSALNDVRTAVEKSGKTEAFNDYMYHMHNIDRMSLETEENRVLREGLKEKLKGYSKKQIESLAMEYIRKDTPKDMREKIETARAYIDSLKGTNKPVFGDSVTADVSKQTVAELEAENPEFKEYAEKIYGINKYLRDMLVENGIISRDTAAKWNDLYPHYVPIHRTNHDGQGINVPLDTNRTGVNAPIKRATGGNSNFYDLFSTMAERVEQTYKAVTKNRFGVELKNTLGTVIESELENEVEQYGILPEGTKVKAHDRDNIGTIKSYNEETGKYAVYFKNEKGYNATVQLDAKVVTPLNPPKQKTDVNIEEIMESVDNHEDLLQKGENGESATFTVFENGKRVKFEITDEMYEAVKPSQFTYTNKTLNTINNVRRDILTTYSPTFALTNPIKDVQDILINSQHPARTYFTIPEAIKEVLSKGHWYQERMENGGDQDSYFDGQKKTFKGEKSKLSKIVGFPFEKIQSVNEVIEQVPRLAEYIASRKMGRSIDVSMLDSARVTTNFGASGDLTNMLNRNGATFLSASVEGFNQQVRNVREAKAEGLKGWAKLAAKTMVIGLPALLLNHLLWDDDEEYEELSDYIKRNYYIVAKFGDGQFLRIPKGRTAAVIQDAFKQMENLITGNDEVDLQAFGDLVLNNLAPNWVGDNWIGAPITQAIGNKAWYGGDLVPTRLQDLPAAEQYDETTDSISKWLGEATNTSPYKWNYILDQYSGGVGDMVLPHLTPSADGGGFGAAMRDKFTADSTLDNQNVTDFYDKKEELTTNANSMYATDKDTLKSRYINAVGSEMSKLYSEKRMIQSSDLSDEEKAAKVREVQRQIDDLAKNGLDTYNNVTFEDDYREGGEYARIGDYVFKKSDSGEWSKLSDDQLTKYEVTRKAGNASYATDGKNHYRWYVPGEDSKEEPGWRKITEDQLKKQKKVTSGLGITASEYWSNIDEYDYAYENPEKYEFLNSIGVGYKKYSKANEDTKNAYTWAYKNQGKYTMSKAITDDFLTFYQYRKDLNDIESNKDANGKTISGSRQRKVVEYLNNLDVDYGARILLYKAEYPSDDTYNKDIVEYLNNRDDISYDEMVTILKELGFTVSADGKTVTWD